MFVELECLRFAVLGLEVYSGLLLFELGLGGVDFYYKTITRNPLNKYRLLLSPPTP